MCEGKQHCAYLSKRLLTRINIKTFSWYCCCFVLAGTAACEKCTSSKLTLAALSLIAHLRKAVA